MNENNMWLSVRVKAFVFHNHFNSAEIKLKISIERAMVECITIVHAPNNNKIYTFNHTNNIGTNQGVWGVFMGILIQQ